MASGIESWLFGYAGTKLADRVLERLRGDALTSDLHKAAHKWAVALPAQAGLASTNALFPSHVPDNQLTERPCLADIRKELKGSRIPTLEGWNRALIEQWRYVRQNVTDPQDFFQLSEAEASHYLNSLAIQFCTVCSQHEALFRTTTVCLLRELLEERDGNRRPSEAIENILLDDQKMLLRLLYQHNGLCRIAAAKGEYECLWVPGAIMDMQWGWERTPEECQLSGKKEGNRKNRLHWIFLVKDLTAAGIFEAQENGYYELTEKGWRVAHAVSNENSDRKP